MLETPLISVCCVCVWLMPHNPKLHCLQLSATCTPIVVRDHSCLWPCYGFFLFCLDFIISPLQFLMGSYLETSMTSAELHFCFKFWPVIDGKGEEKQLLQNVLNKGSEHAQCRRGGKDGTAKPRWQEKETIIKRDSPMKERWEVLLQGSLQVT